ADGGEAEVIPPAHLYSAADGREADGLAATYESMRQYLAYTVKDGDLYAITFEWPDGYLELPIPEPPPGTLITLLGRDGDLPWRYRTGSLRVDLSDVPASEIPGQWAWTVRLEGYAVAVPAEPGVDE
ncbi:MAG: hypothetical protein N2B05_05170, partial [Gemmatimonadales bacterium]